MQLNEILSEGLIKVPSEALGAAQRFFLRTYLGYLWAYANQHAEDETESEMVKHVLRKVASKHDIGKEEYEEQKQLGRQKTTEEDFDFALPERYAKQLEKRGKPARLKFKHVNVLRGKHKKLDGDEGAVFHETPPEMYLSFDRLGLEDKKAFDLVTTGSISELEGRLRDALKTIEHELVHGVQFAALQYLHPKQGEMGSQDVDDPDYLTSNLEFDPQLRNAIAKFDRIVKRSKASKSELIKKFTWSDRVPVGNESHDDERSKYFGALRKADQAKWRKAVKLFSKEV